MTTEAAAVVVPAAEESSVSPPPGTKLLVYGDAPRSTAATHWEETVWSENPAFPPTPLDSDDPLLAAGNSTHSHGAVLDAARAVVDKKGLTADDGVALRASLSDPRTVAAGVVAPLLVGGHVVLPGDARTDASVAVGDGPEESIPLGSVPL